MKSNEEKIEQIAYHFKNIMLTLGSDLTDESLKETPMRVGKMYVNEIFSGLDESTEPKFTTFPNVGNDEMVVVKDITVNSCCEHHFVPFIGVAHVAYIPKGKIVGLSKINRVVNYFSKRPQLQEKLTTDIAKYLQEKLNTDDVAVLVEAKHLCVAIRGIKDNASITKTSHLGGVFKEASARKEFFDLIK